MNKTIVDTYGQIKGIVTYQGNDENSHGTGIDRMGNVIGHYIPGSNLTMDNNGNRIGTGNLLEALVKMS
jgi:hypothetical protein